MARRQTYTPDFKARVVLEILTEGLSLAEAGRKYKIKDTVLSRWRQQFIERSPQIFNSRQAKDQRDERIAELERIIGRLTVELEASKKLSDFLK